jgi:cobalt-zinc-cadmium efflux system protein
MPLHHHDHSMNYNRAFGIAVLLNVCFVAVEAVFGVLSESLALLADAGHNLSDVLGLILAWGAFLLSRRVPTYRRTYGWKGATILAALANAIILLVAVGGISWESVRRLVHPQPVSGYTVIWVSGIGLFINSATAFLFLADRKKDLNIRGAFLHMAADAGVSAGVVVAGLGMIITGWLWIDPVVSLVIAAIILIGTWGLFRDSFNLAMQAVPGDINAQEIAAYLSTIRGVEGVHDLHVWAMSTTENALTAHLVVPHRQDLDTMLAHIKETLHDRFGVPHVTIQVEKTATAMDCDDRCDPELSHKEDES